MKLKKKPAKNQESKPAAPRARRSIAPLAAALLPVVLGLVAMLAVLFQLHQSSATQQTREQVTRLHAAYSQQLDMLTGLIDTNIHALAEGSLLKEAMLQQDSETLARFEKEWSQRAYIHEIVIEATGLERPREGLSFAALDHLGQAATNQPASLEYVAAQGKNLFYQAVPVIHPQQSRVIGTLLAVYDADALLGILTSPKLHEGWQVRLLQQLPRAPQLQLYHAGPGLQSGMPETFRLSHPNWVLEIGIDSPGLLDSPWLIQYLSLPLLLLLSGCAGLFLLQTRYSKQLASDTANLMQAITTGKPQGLALLGNRQLQTLAEPLLKLLQKASRPAAPAAQPAAAPVREAAPVATQGPVKAFGLDDALEIDILDMVLDEDAMQESFIDDAPPGATGDPSLVVPDIFRAYDIRGIVGTNLDENTAYWIGRAAGSESIAQGEARVVTGRDGRLSSPALLEALVRGLTESGCTVLDLGMVPTPLVYFGTHQLEATSGIMVTGSHNPADYNGFKVVIAGETLANERIAALYQRIAGGDLLNAPGSVQQIELLEQYIDYITDDVAVANPLKVVIDCGNGVAGVVAPRLLESIGCNVVPLYCNVDGNFPNHHPDPGNPENLQDLIRKVQAEGADLGLAFDGDGDRLGVVTNKGEIIYPDRLMMLLAKDVVARNPGCDVIFDVKCTRRLAALISRCGGRPVMWKTGHSLMKAKLRETGALLAGEMSGHIFFKERWFGFDDGIYAAARVLEILSIEHDSVDRVFARYPVSPSTPELHLDVTEDSKFAIIQALQAKASWGDGSVNTLDGVRVDFPKGWGLIRASNTTPVLVMRFEGDTEDELQRIQQVFREQLLAVAPDIQWPF